MKRCLICVVGLTRTYAKTFPYFLQHIIISNKHEYIFDIITHSSEMDDNIHELYSKSCTNYYTITNDIQVDNTGSSNIMFIRIMECYKHIHDYLNISTYDLYMFVRFDLLIHFPIRLSNINDNLVCLLDHRCDGPNRRFSDVHDRDWDFSFIGKPNVFKCMIHAIEEYFEKNTNNSYKVRSDIKLSPTNPKWTPETAPAFISKYYNGKQGGRLINGHSYTRCETGCQEYMFTKLNDIGRFLDFKWGGHNCYVGHLVR